MEKVLSYVDLAKQEGGKIATGGGRIILPKPNSNGAFIEPTIVEGLSIDSRCATEDFGPVASVHQFTSDDEAVKNSSITEYGLAGSVWTSDLTRGKCLAENIEEWYFVGKYMAA